MGRPLRRHTVKYARAGEFQRELRRRVDAYFEENRINPKGGFRMVVKSATILLWFVASWALLVFWAQAWWQAIPLTISVALAISAIGFSIQHDGGHGAYARARWANRLAAFTLDVTGGSSFFWRSKHGLLHHQFTNIELLDNDIDARPWLRMADGQERRWYHRYQHWYIWVLYFWLVPKWHAYDDLRALILGRVGSERVERPQRFELFLFVLGKLIFLTWAVLIPLWMGHHIVVILGLYCLGAWVLGVTLATVFQLAHVHADRAFSQVTDDGINRMELSWSEHQLATTADFAPDNPFVTWFVGGLNYQIEHHLFPRISHMHYPKISRIVKSVCEEYGIPHTTYRTFGSALGSHLRYLKQMGRLAAA